MKTAFISARWRLAAIFFLVAAALEAKERESAPLWPMYRGNPQRTGQSRFAGPLPMRIKWKLDLKREICASPAVAADGTIHVGAGAIFYAISPQGQVLWSKDFADGSYSKAPKAGNQSGDNQGFTSSSPALAADGTVLQACGPGRGATSEGFVLAIDPRPEVENRVKWAFPTGRETRSSPLVVGQTCFVGHALLLALDETGKRRWEGGKSDFPAVTSSPALSRDGKTIYIGGFDGRLHALDVGTGGEKWTAPRQTKPPLRLPEWDRQGAQVRGLTTSGYVPEAPAVGADETIYFGSWDGHLYAAAPNGQLRWSINLADRISSAPAIASDGRLLVCTYEGTLYCLRTGDASPTVDWHATAYGRYSAPLLSADGKVYLGGLDGKLRAYAMSSGRLLDELALGGWIHASPVPGGEGVLYLGASDGFLRAVETGPSSSDPGRVAPARPGKKAEPGSPGGLPSRAIPSKRIEATPLPPANDPEALALARAYLEDEDETRRAEILRKAEGWSQRLDEIAAALRPVPAAAFRTGYLDSEKFTVPRLRARMERLRPRPEGPVLPYVPPKGGTLKGPAPGEEYLQWLYVPPTYNPKKPLPLVITLHGGAGSNAQSAAGEMLRGTVKLFGTRDFVVVAPSTPPMIYRWGNSKFCFPESETHLQAVIEECSARYAIDPNRIFLAGHSMGGIGSWWHAFRQGDRFAAIAPMSGTWRGAWWPKLHGTPLYLMHGAFDHHGTHVDFDRYAHAQLTVLGVPHIEAEYLGGHGLGMAEHQRESLVEFFKLTKRDPYSSHVCAISPFVPDSEEMRGRYPHQPYGYWLSVLETGSEGVLVDMPTWDTDRVYESGETGGRKWQRNMFAVKRQVMRAGAVEAENLGGNRFRIKTNVKRFALWLHPKMGIDFAKPIEIERIAIRVDPEKKIESDVRRERITAVARPSLAAMLKYLGDRRDYGLIYHAVVEVNCRD